MAPRVWTDGSGTALSAANLNAMESDIAAARTNGAADAKAYTDSESLKDRTRLTDIEAKQVIKCVRLESGSWVWDTAAGTHYLILDLDGSLIVRASAQPIPASTPVLNW